MPHLDPANPYEAPEASIAALRPVSRRPPVYSAISIICWFMGVCVGFGSAAGLIMYGLGSFWYGWRQMLLTGDGPRGTLLTALGVSTTILYIAAARSLRDRRGTPGLILCSIAIALSYAISWLFTSK